MAGFVNIGGIVYGGSANQVGTFNGQNMMPGWDSHAPNISNLGTLMGQLSLQGTSVAVLNNGMTIGQPIVDQDVKDNASPLAEGP